MYTSARRYRIKFPISHRTKASFNFVRALPARPLHGPQAWPWWRIASLSAVRLSVEPPSAGWRLWIYTRWGAPFFDFYLDRRAISTG